MEVRVGERHLRLLVGKLRLQIREVSLILLHLRVGDLRVDLGQQLALLSPSIADIDIQLLKLAGDLRADIDIVARLQIAERRDGVFDIALA